MNAKLKALFAVAAVDSIVLRTYPNNVDPAFFYSSGIPVGQLDNNLLILSAGRKPLLVRSVIDAEINNRGIRIKTVKRRKQMETILRSELRGKRVGVNMDVLSASSLKRLRKEVRGKTFVDISKELANARAIKSASEISKIAQAAKITEQALNALPNIFRRGMTEKQLALKLEFLLREKSGDNVSFPPIVASGRNSAFPHHVPLDRKIRKGLVLIDCGTRFKGYCADLTRVFSVGKPSTREQKTYATVFEAKVLGESLCVEGSHAANVFKQSSAFLKRNIGQNLIHGMGHGLGLEVHDAPSGFAEGSKTVLKSGMVFTVEPGVYLKGFGIRIEDDVVVGKNKCRKLSSAPDELIRLR